MRTVLAPCGFGLAVLFVAVPSALAQSPFDFTSAIRPIMERSCWNCHGEAVQLSSLD